MTNEIPCPVEPGLPQVGRWCWMAWVPTCLAPGGDSDRVTQDYFAGRANALGPAALAGSPRSLSQGLDRGRHWISAVAAGLVYANRLADKEPGSKIMGTALAKHKTATVTAGGVGAPVV